MRHASYKPKASLESKLVAAALVCIVVVGVGVVAIKSTGGINWEFSDGSRSGIVQKLSKKGVIWKTWEGQLNLGYTESVSDGNGHQSIQPAMFHFSVADEEVAKRIKLAEVSGTRVTIDYKQYFLRGWDKGGTSYNAVGVADAKSIAIED